MNIDHAKWLVTCEHGGNAVPDDVREVFSSEHAQRTLRSHRGWDPGAWEASLQFADHLFPGHHRPSWSDKAGWETAYDGDWIAARTTRLLVDLNRSPDHETVFSKWSGALSPERKQRLLCDWHTPYRSAVERRVGELLVDWDTVIHLSVHSFTPRYHGRWRPIDVGLLFDPDRPQEADFCESWKRQMNSLAPRLRVLANQPYLGSDDGLTTHLRRRFPELRYLGIEIEVNHRFFKCSPAAQASVVRMLIESIST